MNGFKMKELFKKLSFLIYNIKKFSKQGKKEEILKIIQLKLLVN